MLAVSAAVPASSLVALGQNHSKPPSSSPGAAGVSATDPLARLKQEDFARYLYTEFRIRLSKTTVWKTELYQVVDNKSGELQGLDNFSLVFRGVHTTQLRQNTYQFEHTQLGIFNLFIVPAGSQGNLKFYQAIFNRV
jgi:hypothetical protein